MMSKAVVHLLSNLVLTQLLSPGDGRYLMSAKVLRRLLRLTYRRADARW